MSSAESGHHNLFIILSLGANRKPNRCVRFPPRAASEVSSFLEGLQQHACQVNSRNQISSFFQPNKPRKTHVDSHSCTGMLHKAKQKGRCTEACCGKAAGWDASELNAPPLNGEEATLLLLKHEPIFLCRKHDDVPPETKNNFLKIQDVCDMGAQVLHNHARRANTNFSSSFF